MVIESLLQDSCDFNEPFTFQVCRMPGKKLYKAHQLLVIYWLLEHLYPRTIYLQPISNAHELLIIGIRQEHF